MVKFCNRLKSIIAKLGTDQFPRVKIGIGSPPHPDYDVVDWVIGKRSDAEYKTIREAAERALEAVEEIIQKGVNAAMNDFNG